MGGRKFNKPFPVGVQQKLAFSRNVKNVKSTKKKNKIQ